MCAKFPVYCSALRVIWVWKINAQPLIIKIKRFLSSLVSVGVVIALVVGSFFILAFVSLRRVISVGFTHSTWAVQLSGLMIALVNGMVAISVVMPKNSSPKVCIFVLWHIKKEPSLLSKRYALLTVTFSKAKGLQSLQYPIYNTVIIIIMIIISLLCAFVWFFFPIFFFSSSSSSDFCFVFFQLDRHGLGMKSIRTNVCVHNKYDKLCYAMLLCTCY